MHAYLRRAALVGATLTLFAPAAGDAQQLGGLVVRASSPNVELPDPDGIGVFAELDASGFGFRLTYLRYSDSTRKQGTVCQVYSPRIGCVLEGVDMSTRLGGLRFDVQKLLGLGDLAEVGVGGGMSFNSLTASATGDSGRDADLHLPKTGQIGRQATATLSVTPVPGVPFKLVGSYAFHWVHFKGCVAADDPTSGYAPFCGTDRFREIQVGASFTLPRQY
jgi:hypothetical protein